MSFAAIAAATIHDVKNRLAQLAGRAEINGDRESLRVVLEAAATLSALLAFYRTETGVLPIAIDARSPADLLVELSTCSILPESLSIASCCDNAPAIGYYDEVLVRMVLTIAIQNAQRHARARILVSAVLNDGFLEFAVHDDGDGYAPTVLAGAATPVSREGTGLGLQLASRIAAMHVHAGRVGCVRLANERGAVFRLLLPM